jgi:hypothetical protein
MITLAFLESNKMYWYIKKIKMSDKNLRWDQWPYILGETMGNNTCKNIVCWELPAISSTSVPVGSTLFYKPVVEAVNSRTTFSVNPLYIELNSGSVQ